MRKLIYILLLFISNAAFSTEVLIAGDHTQVTPKNMKSNGVCFLVEKIDQKLFIDLYVPAMLKGRKFSHIWVGGDKQYGVEVTPEKMGNMYKIQISGSPEELKVVGATIAYLNSGKDLASLIFGFYDFFDSENKFLNGNRCNQANE